PIVLVQDYHFALVPQMLRRRFPHATILTFWHIPWPNVERFAMYPYGPPLLDGLLVSSIVGFQTHQHCQNFMDSVAEAAGARVDREDQAMVYKGHTTWVRSYPISIEWPSRWAASAAPIKECRRSVRAEFGIDPQSQVVLAVDRLDYTKGIEERLAAVERILSCGRATRRPMVLLQVAAPTRVRVQRYQELRERVRLQVERINAQFGDPRFTPVLYIDRYVAPVDVFRYYRAADVCYVGSLDDGMNLVA